MNVNKSDLNSTSGLTMYPSSNTEDKLQFTFFFEPNLFWFIDKFTGEFYLINDDIYFK